MIYKLLLFLLFFFPLAYFYPPIMTNQNARYALVFSLVEDKSLRIDRYVEATPRGSLLDKAFYKGHYYSDKPPLPAFLGALIYKGLSLFKKPVRSKASYFNLAHFIRILVISLPQALFALFLFRLGKSKTHHLLALLLTLSYALGTLAFPYSTLFYGHVLAGIFLFLSFFCLFKRQWLFAGFLSGLGFSSDFLSALFVPVAFLFGIMQPRKTLVFLSGFLLGSLPVWIYNTLCFESPFRFAYSFEVEESFRQAHERGLFGIGLPSFLVVKALLFGERGLFFLSPHLLFALFSILFLPRQKNFREPLFCFFLFALFLFFNSGYYMPFGGWSLGPRFLVPALPFLTYLLFFLPPLFQWMSLILSLWGILFMQTAVAVVPLVPDSVSQPFFAYLFPKLLKRELGKNAGLIFGLSPGASLALYFLVEGALVATACSKLISRKL